MSKSKLREEYEARFGVVEGSLRLYDDKGNKIYWEDSDSLWWKSEFDADNNVIYYEASDGHWLKYEYDVNGNEIYYEDSKGLIRDNRPCINKVFIDEQSGKKFKLMEIK